ncbi:hypothetical protein [Rhodococcus tibetensis]|uniref:Uncharacterized protein n=1 Tax=Rhodococcus tibetensis TaxID=2965064 RepID=A0ABT1QL49_9NOCA|nr:hypothetical protein [Rhodococcus sp. FXJ9.536]MCQ4122520.1 hypothetical protein [Rhodococcus sp. FXJ9.536]
MSNESRSNESSEDRDAPKGGRPGPADQGKDGGMATRENAPELVEESKRSDDTGK